MMENEIYEDSLSTPRLRFRKWNLDDAPSLLEMYSLKEVYQYLGSNPAPLQGLSKAEAAIKRWDEKTLGALGFWAVVPKEGIFADTPIGTVILVPLQRSDDLPCDDIEIGWHFHPKAWGNGYATEAAKALIDRAKAFGISEVHAVVYPANTKSLAVCDRLAMTRLGETNEWYKTTVVDHLLDLRRTLEPLTEGT